MLLGTSYLVLDGFRLAVQHSGSWFLPLALLIFYTVLCAVFPIISYVSYRNIWTGAPLE